MRYEPLIRHVYSRLSGTWGDDPDESQNTVLCLRVADFDYKRLGVIPPTTKRKIDHKEFRMKLVAEGDILIEKSGGGEKTPVGRAVLISKVDTPITYANFIERIRFRSTIIPSYANYLLSDLYASRTNTKYIKQNTGIQNLDIKAYLQEPVAIPSVDKQASVVDMLDRQTATIDEILTAKKHLHALLVEMQTATITQDMLGKMKSSAQYQETGIPWIGAIPDSWKIKKIKHVASVKARIGWQALTTDEYIDEGPYLVTGTDFREGIIDWSTSAHVSDQRWAIDSNIQLEEDDLLLTKDGTIGKVAVVKGLAGRATLNSGVFVVRSKKQEYNPRFLYYVLKSDVFNGFIQYMKTGSTIVHLYQKTFVEFNFPLPSIEEQDDIVAKLDAKLSRIDQALGKLQNSTNLLYEYRASLISNAVAGELEP